MTAISTNFFIQLNVFFHSHKHSENQLTKLLKAGSKFFLGIEYIALVINPHNHIQINLDPRRCEFPTATERHKHMLTLTFITHGRVLSHVIKVHSARP